MLQINKKMARAFVANALFYGGGMSLTGGLYQLHHAFAFIVAGAGALWIGYRIHRG